MHHGDMDGKLIFKYVRRVSLLKYMSYPGERLKPSATAIILPEIKPFLLDFGNDALSQWEQEMEHLNMLLLRGSKMRLLPIDQNLRFFTSLDQYIVRMHADKLARCLEALIRFAEKLEPLAVSEPSVRGWFFHEDLGIQRRHWYQLASSVMNLLKLLGDLDQDSQNSQDSRHQLLPDAWPNQEVLRDVMRRAVRMYGVHAMSDPDQRHQPTTASGHPSAAEDLRRAAMC